MRWARTDGGTEEYSFTEVDRSLQVGLSLQGAGWGRQQDTVGVALIRNGLAGPDQAYLAAGGLGFFLADGKLNYRPEQIVEVYYSVNLYKKSWLTLDYQQIANPGYNVDRHGRYTSRGFRLHAEF